MHITIKMFDDRLVIESPGGFPPLVTPENIYETQHSRNPYLMDALYYLDFVKMANEGVRRMRDTMIENRLPAPEFRQRIMTHSSVEVILRNDIKQRKMWLDSDASEVVGEVIFRTLTMDERRLINWVAENGSINVSQAVRLTSKSWGTSKKILMKLVGRGILRHVIRDYVDRDSKAHFVLRQAEEN
jgi:ATP-dependent DNA helicase RecG